MGTSTTGDSLPVNVRGCNIRLPLADKRGMYIKIFLKQEGFKIEQKRVHCRSF